MRQNRTQRFGEAELHDRRVIPRSQQGIDATFGVHTDGSPDIGVLLGERSPGTPDRSKRSIVKPEDLIHSDRGERNHLFHQHGNKLLGRRIEHDGTRKGILHPLGPLLFADRKSKTVALGANGSRFAGHRHRLKRGTVRDWLFHRATNGLAKCGAVIKKGRRLYLYEASFLQWLRETEPVNRRHIAGGPPILLHSDKRRRS